MSSTIRTLITFVAPGYVSSGSARLRRSARADLFHDAGHRQAVLAHQAVNRQTGRVLDRAVVSRSDGHGHRTLLVEVALRELHELGILVGAGEHDDHALCELLRLRRAFGARD